MRPAVKRFNSESAPQRSSGFRPCHCGDLFETSLDFTQERAIEDFRAPLEELSVIKVVSGIGPYQMRHIWMLKLRTSEAKKNVLLGTGGNHVKGRYCAVIDPVKKEITVKLNWAAFDVPNEAIRNVLSEYGDVKEVKLQERCVPGFEQAESTTRVARIRPFVRASLRTSCQTSLSFKVEQIW
ncbi:hypothetical protein HPB51_010164 [Rhipicephalus microplus]|uniref:Uncharacterized protein n=1 Tax=Rhipicephalus microplus TaxID=6941 RepID=A0A9J6F2Q7_RHIMP|nr:hypothetical protein HPB51_010164 [Rhipicephalus microplus]